MGYIKLKDLPIGSKISFGKYQVEAETPQSIIWEIVDSNYYVGNYSNPSTITLMTAGIIDFRAVDWQEHIRPDEGTNTSEARAGGYNYYFQSNIDQWLNSDKAGGEWFTAQHTYDTPPSTWVLSVNPNFDYNGLKLFYRNHPGFLYYFTQEERDLLIPVKINCYWGGESKYNSTSTVSATRKVYLPSADEFAGYYSGSSPFAYFSDITKRKRIPTSQCASYTKYYNSGDSSRNNFTKEQPIWTRDSSSTMVGYRNSFLYTIEYNDSSTNRISGNANIATLPEGICPIINLSPDTYVSALPDSNGNYTVLEDQNPPEHTHNWSTEWSSNSTHHWHECLTADCPNTQNAEKADYGTHVSSDWIIVTEATDKAAGLQHKICTVCGRELETETIPKLPGFNGKKIGSMPTGTKVKFGKYRIGTEAPQDIIWEIMEVNHSGYPDKSVTLGTVNIIDYFPFDALESSNSVTGISKYGNNRWSISNIRKWLNSNASAGNWYSSQHSYDAPPTAANTQNSVAYNTRAGFLNLFSQEEQDMILTTTNVTGIPPNQGSGTETTQDKVFLPSRIECSGDTNAGSYGALEGKQLYGFNTSTKRHRYCTQQCVSYGSGYNKPTSTTSAGYYRIRTPNSSTSASYSALYYGSSSGSCTTGTSGTIAAYSRPYTPIGIVPLCNISYNCLVSDVTDSDGCYTLQPPQPHVHSWSTLWQSNATAHWHNCNVSDCDITDVTQKDGYGLHTGEWVVEKEPTYYEAGLKKKVCTTCGYIMETEEIPILEIPEVMTVEIKNPIYTDHMITEMYISTFEKGEMDYITSIMVCNNAFDKNPTWEDVTDYVLEKEMITLENDTKTADNWGISFKITMQKEEPIPNKKITLNCFGISYR